MGLSQAYHQNEEEEMTEPVSPTGQYFNSSVLSVCVIGVLESQVPIDDTPTMTLLRDVFLPISPRFSSIMVCDENGDKQWKRVDVKLKNHVKIPTFPNGLTPSSYDTYFNNYISKIAMQQLPKTQPLWEIHIIKYPTINAAGNLIFKLHHALGDGFSLMGALLSCLQRADNPSLPLTFPSLRDSNWKLSHTTGGESYTKKDPRMLLTRIFGSVFNSMLDFGWSLVKSSLLEDDKSPIRSGSDAVEFKPIDVSTLTFSLDHIKQIKSRVGVSINDVITGMIFHGIRLYMQGIDKDSTNTQSTALVLLNTRVVGGYKSVQEMVKPNAESPWGNQFGFLHVSLPDLAAAADHGSSNPLEFVYKAQQIIQSKRNSLGVFLTGRLLEASRKLRGPETTAKYIYSTLKNSSMTISNVIGPVEQMSLADHPIKGLYFMVVGVPQSLTITVLSYTGQLRIAVGTEKDFIDSEKFKSCIETAFDILFKYSK